MLTLLGFMCGLWTLCIFVLAYRYQSRPFWSTGVALIVSLLVATVVGMEEQYEPLAYLVSCNVTLLGSLIVVCCFGNNEKLEWTADVTEVIHGMRADIKLMRSEYNELSKRIKR